MFSKRMLRSAVSVLGLVFAVSICIGLSAGIASAQDCSGDDDFTTEFRLQDCRYFKSIGKNPYFKLIPGFKLVLESDEEKSEITVLWETKWIDLRDEGFGWIKTRVVEERAYELEVEDGEVEETLVEISRNWFAICAKTNAVYYFGEWSRDCEDGFDENDQCDDESNEGSWEAGEADAMPGLIMPGTFLLGSRYFQEQAPDNDAEDRGENTAMDVDVSVPAGEFEDCVEVEDTNPAEDVCQGNGEAKIYCPGVGLVQDEDLVLVEYGYQHYRPWCRYR